MMVFFPLKSAVVRALGGSLLAERNCRCATGSQKVKAMAPVGLSVGFPYSPVNLEDTQGSTRLQIAFQRSLEPRLLQVLIPGFHSYSQMEAMESSAPFDTQVPEKGTP